MNKELIVGWIYFNCVILEIMARMVIYLVCIHYLINNIYLSPLFLISKISFGLIGGIFIIKPFIDFITRKEFKLKCN